MRFTFAFVGSINRALLESRYLYSCWYFILQVQRVTSARRVELMVSVQIKKDNTVKISYRPGVSSLKGQGYFHFAKGTSIGKS